jgi:ubiquinone/menaquinone biosynthesis C-methylase UbiE
MNTRFFVRTISSDYPKETIVSQAQQDAIGSEDTFEAANFDRCSLSDDGYLSPTPIMVIDGDARVVESNLAADLLFGADLRIRGASKEQFANAFSAKTKIRSPGCRKGALQRERCATGAEMFNLVYQSQRFGAARIRVTKVNLMDSPNDRNYWTCYFETLSVAKNGDYRASVLAALCHELTWMKYAVSYDRVLLEMPYYRLVLRRHCRAMSVDGIHRIADLGCGTGILVEPLLRRGKQVIAVDSSRAMLHRLRTKPWANHPNLRMLRQSAEDLRNIPDESVDGVSILLALFDTEQPDKTLGEAVRILRPGGSLIITEPKRAFNIDVILERCVRRLRRIGKYELLHRDFERVMAANQILDPNRRQEQYPMRAETIAEVLRQRDFGGVRMRDSHFRQCATVSATKNRNYAFGG